MCIVDLHIHSNHSDGTFNTNELLALLNNADVDFFSFTDHDNISCYFDLEKLKYSGKKIHYVRGVELSFSCHGQIRDMLGYGIDINTMKEFLDLYYADEITIKKQNYILEQFKHICATLDLKFDEDIRCCSGKKAEAFILMHESLNRYSENIEKYPFIQHNTKFYWEHFANRNSPFFVDETFDLPTTSDVVSAIHKAGGLAFLAHPCAYGLSKEHVEELICLAVNIGIDGLEVYHSSNKNDDVEFLKSQAHINHLYMSGGSDFHGNIKPKLKLVTGYENMKVNYMDLQPWLSKVERFSIGK